MEMNFHVEIIFVNIISEGHMIGFSKSVWSMGFWLHCDSIHPENMDPGPLYDHKYAGTYITPFRSLLIPKILIFQRLWRLSQSMGYSFIFT